MQCTRCCISCVVVTRFGCISCSLQTQCKWHTPCSLHIEGLLTKMKTSFLEWFFLYCVRCKDQYCTLYAGTCPQGSVLYTMLEHAHKDQYCTLYAGTCPQGSALYTVCWNMPTRKSHVGSDLVNEEATIPGLLFCHQKHSKQCSRVWAVVLCWCRNA